MNKINIYMNIIMKSGSSIEPTSMALLEDGDGEDEGGRLPLLTTARILHR